jgi:hypothetical protein
MASKRPKKRKPLPVILIVDDKIEEADSRSQALSGQAVVLPRTPDDVSQSDLDRADLVLVDYLLDEWQQDKGLGISSRPNNGVALAAVLRSHCESGANTGFALHSGQLSGLSSGLPPARQLHAIARHNNLEWVFSKNDDENARALEEQAVSLSRAFRELPKRWPTGAASRTRTTVERLLQLRKVGWREQAWKHVAACRPPMFELDPPTHGVTFIRWLLTRVLPYPTFLWDYRYLSARLRVTPASLLTALKQDKKFGRSIEPFRYHGVLECFIGDRWWVAGIEKWLWDETGGAVSSSKDFAKFVKSLSRRLVLVAVAEPVVVLDSEMRAIDELQDLSTCVEIWPEDWPSYADRPWATRDSVSNSEWLKSISLLPRAL